MTNLYGEPVTALIEALSRLPGIGGKSAQRLAFHIIRMPKERSQGLATAILTAINNVRYCSLCCNLADTDPCGICQSAKRDPHMIMVVEDPRDMAAYERTHEFHGLYHILHGVLSPMNGIGPNDLKIAELLRRIQTAPSQEAVEEVITATNPTVEGEATAMYISKLLRPLGIKVTRIAHGVPVGGDLEFVDEVTLTKALEGRIEI